MDLFIMFFRDFLDGPLYIVVAIICGILICSCIGYLGEQYLNKQKQKQEYEITHAAIASQTIDAASISTEIVSKEKADVTSLKQDIISTVTDTTGSDSNPN